MRRAPTAVAVLLVAACSRGHHPAPRPTAAPATTPANAIREAAQRTLAACPCRVTVRVTVPGRPGPEFEGTGVWDPARGTAELRRGNETLRVAGGAAYFSPARRWGVAPTPWARLAVTSVPERPATLFPALAVADPAVAFALAGAASGDAGDAGGQRDGYAATADAVAAAGPRGVAVRAAVRGDSAYFRVYDGPAGTIGQVVWNPGSPNAADRVWVYLEVDALHVTAPAVAAPPAAQVTEVDAVRLNSLTAKRYGAL